MVHGLAGLAHASINTWPMLLLAGSAEQVRRCGEFLCTTITFRSYAGVSVHGFHVSASQMRQCLCRFLHVRTAACVVIEQVTSSVLS